MKILLTGKNGQVGWELQRTLASFGEVCAFDRQELNLGEPSVISKKVRELKPDLIVNAGAYTAVDKAEEEQEIAHAINSVAPGILAEEAKKCDAILVHYSTDYVFDGNVERPYHELDLTNPLNVYGKTKLGGELAIEAVGGKYLILRTSWVYGNRGKNFLLTMLKLSQERDQLKIVGDQIGAPTWSRSIAKMTGQILDQIVKLNSFEKWGIYHLTCAGQTSWYGFAEAIFKNTELKNATILHQINSEQYPLPAARPHYSVLSNQKLSKTFGLKMADWQQSLIECMDKFIRFPC